MIFSNSKSLTANDRISKTKVSNMKLDPPDFLGPVLYPFKKEPTYTIKGEPLHSEVSDGMFCCPVCGHMELKQYHQTVFPTFDPYHDYKESGKLICANCGYEPIGKFKIDVPNK